MRLDELETTTLTPEVKVTTVQTPDTAPTSLVGWLPILWSQVLFPGSTAEASVWRWRPFVAVFLLSGVLLYPCMSFALFEPDEGRYAQIPREMLTTGEWIVPTLHGEAYLDKPPLFYWLVMLSYSILGYSDAAARLISALAIHATLIVTYVLGRRIVGEREAFWAALLLAVSPIFLAVGRLLVLDGLLTLWITTAALCVYVAHDGPQLRTGWWIVASIACALGVLTKGPVALLLVMPPLFVHRWLVAPGVIVARTRGSDPTPHSGECGYGARTRGSGSPHAGECGYGANWRAWTLFFGIVAVVNLPWYIAVCIQRPEFARYFLWQHNVQRFVEPFDHVRPVWFYGPILLYGLLPIAFFAWPIGRFFTSMRSEDTDARCPALGYLLLSAAWCVLFFSMAGSKLPTYILPAFPLLCLALGGFIARTEWRRSRWLMGLIAAAWLVQMAANYVVMPSYAQSRSPMGQFDEMMQRCSDPAVPVICFPRNVDSVAFYTGRRDFRTFRSKEMDAVIQALDEAPRTVVLFGHRNSPETLARNLPAHLRLIDRRPMGLCESAIVERVHQAPAAARASK